MERLFKIKDKVLRQANCKKTALVVRLGAIGDLIMITPALRQLKKDGYYVVLNCHTKSHVVTCNPNIDAMIQQKPNEVPREKLGEYWDELSKGFDKVINLTGSVEDGLLKRAGTLEFNLPKKMRHELCDKNYIDHTMELSGYPDIKGAMPELFFSKAEHEWAKKFMSKLKDKFVILWSLSGSSFHKVWPYTEQTACEFLDAHPDTHLITVGDEACKILEWEHPRTLNRSARFTIRQSMILTKYVDLVIGTETGILNAASCYDTPKIIMLSHSSNENLTKHWKNVDIVEPNVNCYPCHQLHYQRKSCPLNSATKTPLCMTMVRPEQVLFRMEKFYKLARRKVA